jgi:hypothetical protein
MKMHYGIIIKKITLAMLLVVLLISILIDFECFYATHINSNISKLQIGFMRFYIIYIFFASNLIIFFSKKIVIFFFLSLYYWFGIQALFTEHPYKAALIFFSMIIIHGLAFLIKKSKFLNPPRIDGS